MNRILSLVQTKADMNSFVRKKATYFIGKGGMIVINAKLILPVVLALTTSLTGVSAATNAGSDDTDTRPAISAQYEEKLSEKLESGEITQEKYDEIINAVESGEFRGAWGKGAMRGNRWNADELTEEQKADFSAKITEKLAEKLESGEITQEQYDKIIAAIESGDFRSAWGNNETKGNRFNADELTEEQKAEFAEKWSENIQNGKFGSFLGNRFNAEELTDEQKAEIEEKWSENIQNGKFGSFFGNRFNTEELTDEQKAEIEEKQAEVTKGNGFAAFRSGMHGNFGARNK